MRSFKSLMMSTADTHTNPHSLPTMSFGTSELQSLEAQFLDAIATQNLEQISSVEKKYGALLAEVEDAASTGQLGAETADLVHSVMVRIQILTQLAHTADSSEREIGDELAQLVDARLSLEDTQPVAAPSTPPATPPPAPKPRRARATPAMPVYIAPAYRWLLQHLYKPYPSAATITNIVNEACDAAGPDQPLTTDAQVRAWFNAARRKMSWNKHLKGHFHGSKPDIIRAARKYFGVKVLRNALGEVKPEPDISDDDNDLDPALKGAFVEIEALAKELYGNKFTPSDLVDKMGGAVKRWSPELDSKAKRERIAREKARMAYPSPEPTSPESSGSVVRKRSSSESGDEHDAPRSRKRSRNDDGPPTPPDSTRSSPAPTSRKRRLSESDSQAGPSAAKRIRTASLPVVDVATTTHSFDFLAEWFANPADILDSVDVKSFQLTDFDLSTEEDSPLGSPSGSTTALDSFPPNWPLQMDTSELDLDAILQSCSYSPSSFNLSEPQIYTGDAESNLLFESFIVQPPSSLFDLSKTSADLFPDFYASSTAF
ncbi:hypothetical protein C8F01DRAFT_1108103, partial [Mycena amicta]